MMDPLDSSRAMGCRGPRASIGRMADRDLVLLLLATAAVFVLVALLVRVRRARRRAGQRYPGTRDPWRRARGRGEEGETPEPELPPPPAILEEAPGESSVEKPRAEAAEAASPPRAGVAPGWGGSPAERCFDLYREQRFTDAIQLGLRALEAADRATQPPAETARLWGVVGLAKQGLGDHDGARAAFEEAIAVAPDDDRPTWDRHLATLSLTMGQRLLARARRGAGAEASEPVRAVRAAITWLTRGSASAPADARLAEALDTARGALWPTYEDTAEALVRRQQFRAARQLLEEALGDGELPEGRRAPFRQLLARTFSGEVGQLSVEAIRAIQEARHEAALGALERAEALLRSLADDALAPARRQEVEQRLWWSYSTLGLRRTELGSFEEAVEPLFRALGFGSVGIERLDETRRTLVRALTALAETREAEIRRLVGRGDRANAADQGEYLRSLLATAVDRGVPRDELAAPLVAVDRLVAELGGRSG